MDEIENFDIAKVEERLKNGENPRNIKMELAYSIID